MVKAAMAERTGDGYKCQQQVPVLSKHIQPTSWGVRWSTTFKGQVSHDGGRMWVAGYPLGWDLHFVALASLREEAVAHEYGSLSREI